MRRTALMLLILAVGGAPAAAGPIDPVVIGQDASWVAHLDIEAMLASGVGKAVMDKAEAPDVAAKINDFAKAFGFDPRKDLAAVTLWGHGYEEGQGVGVFRGSYDRQKLLALLDENEHHTKTAYGERFLHTWKQEPQGPRDDGVRVGAFADDQTVIIARNADWARHALDVLDGQARHVAPHRLPSLRAGTFLVVAGEDLGQLADKAPRAKWTRFVSSGVIQLGQADADVFLHVSVVAKQPENADRLRKTLAGLLAMTQLAMQDAVENNKPAAVWKPLLDAASVGGEGLAVTLDVQMDQERLTTMLREAKERQVRPPLLPGMPAGPHRRDEVRVQPGR